MAKCPCGTDKEFDQCCGPIISGSVPAPTAEALMRSRYSAFVNCELDHLRDSMIQEHRDDFDEEGVRTWAETADWKRLVIHGLKDGLEGDETGEVEFSAHFSQQGVDQEHRELAFFCREDGKWLYVDGNVHGRTPVVRETPKIGRNEPCPCGSGKKYKKCCGR